MRFRFGLPMLQTVSMLLILWAPWAPGAHKFDIVLPEGSGFVEYKGWTLLPNLVVFDARDWAQAVNLPAILFELPVDIAIDSVRKEPRLPNPRMRFFLFWSVGLLVWYFLGRFVEDVVSWIRSGSLPRSQLADVAFAVEATLVAVLGVLVSVFGRSTEFPVLNWSSAIWLMVASVILSVRLLQIVRYRRKRIVC